MLFPIGPKPFELTLAIPIEQFWQRPRRVKAARAQWDQVAAGLVQNGLDTARAARRAHAALLQAQDRLAAAREAAGLRTQIAAMAEARFHAGDISQLESRAAAIDAEAAADLARRAEHDLSIARDRLRVTMGLAPGTDADGVRLGDRSRRAGAGRRASRTGLGRALRPSRGRARGGGGGGARQVGAVAAAWRWA